MADNKEYLMYKGRPLVRTGNILFYGSPADDYMIMMQILDTKPGSNDITTATKVAVQLQSNNDDAKVRIVKEATKDSLGAAMDIANVWLERALNENN